MLFRSAFDTVCGSVEALVRHVGREHEAWEFEGVEGLVEVGMGGGRQGVRRALVAPFQEVELLGGRAPVAQRKGILKGVDQ